MTNSPDLTMLWEAADAAITLRERFGFDNRGGATEWVRSVLAEHYGIALEACERIVMSDANALAWVTSDHGPLIVKWSVASDRFDRLTEIAVLTTWLAERDCPVSAPLASRSGASSTRRDEALITVQRLIPGDHLDVGRLDAVRAAGAELARLHEHLAVYPRVADINAGVLPVPSSPKEWIEGWMADAPPHVPAEALTRLKDLVEQAPTDAMETQLVHGDYRAANLLFAGSNVTAILDFEEMRADYRVGELARSAVMLGTLFRDWGPVPGAVHDALREGYESVSALDATQAAWWRPLVLWWALLMVPDGDDPTGWAAAAQEVAEHTQVA